MLLEPIKKLLVAKYLYIKGDPNALETAKSAIRDMQHGIDKMPQFCSKSLLTFALKTYDDIKLKHDTDKEEQINFLLSKISNLLLLPFPEVDLPVVDGWDVQPWVDPEFPPHPDWQRIRDIPEIFEKNPELVMLRAGDKFIQAENGGGCSVISSMISIRNFDPKLLTDPVYPKSANGDAVYSPSGHFIVKLCIGGVWRIVDVDDYVPWSCKKALITCKGSVLPLIIEKAYLKSMGGYDFKGSNAALDTYRISGAYPIYFDLQNFHVHNLYLPSENPVERLFTRFREKVAFVSIGTGDNAPPNLQRNHDFAVINIDERGSMQIVNPWDDTPIFYDWQTIKSTFKILYVNICRDFLKHVSKFSEILRTKRTYEFPGLLYHYPQFIVENHSDEPVTQICTVSVKPNSHEISALMQIKAFCGQEFLESNGPLFSAEEAPLLKETPETSALSLSLLLTVRPKERLVLVTIVKDVLGNLSSVALQIQIAAEKNVEARRIPKNFGDYKVQRGDWLVKAGNYGNWRYPLNPQFLLKVDTVCKAVDFFLHSDAPCQLAVFLFDEKKTKDPIYSDLIQNSGAYGPGFQSVRLNNVRPGTYLVIPSLFEPTRTQYIIFTRCLQSFWFEKRPSITSGYFQSSLKGDRSVSALTIVPTKPRTRVIIYISDNVTVESRELVISHLTSIPITWKYGQTFELEAYTDSPAKVHEG